MKRFFVVASVAVALLFQFGCATDEQPTSPTVTDSSTIGAPPFAGDVHLEDMSEDEVRALALKTPLEMITVLEGTAKVKLQVRFRGLRDVGFGFPLYECEFIDASADALAGISAGMSGSPIGPPGRVMGAVAYGRGFSKAPYPFLVTPIDAMKASIEHRTLAEFLEEAPAAPMHSLYAPVKTPVMVSGIQAHRLREISAYLEGSEFDFVEFYATFDGAPAAPPAGFSPRLSAGDMIGVALVTGDVTNTIGFGTVTQVYDDKFVAFGHPMSSTGYASLPVYKAGVRGIETSLQSSAKSSYAIGNPIGTITKDLTPAIVGELGPVPETIPVTIVYQPVNNSATETHHAVSYGYEHLIAMTVATTVDALRMERSPGSTEGTVTLAFKETDSVYTESFRVASANPFMEVVDTVNAIVGGFTELLTNNFSKATLKSVSISVTDSPRIVRALIDEITVPDEITAGESVNVTVVLLPHWSVAPDDGRTMQREVTFEVPAAFPAGEAIVTVSAAVLGIPPQDAAQGPPPQDAIPGFGQDMPNPKNLDELIEQKLAEQVELGLIKVTLMPAGFGENLPSGPIEGAPPQEVPLPLPADIEELPDIGAELVIDGFIVAGTQSAPIMILPAADGE